MQAMGVETKPPNVQVMDHSNPLARLNGVHIEQVRRIAEACLGCEMANEYSKPAPRPRPAPEPLLPAAPHLTRYSAPVKKK